MPTKHLLIRGKVQGVFYRASARERAEQLSLTGWVRNTAEGHVELIVSGEEPAIAQFIDWCWQGPSRATVISVEVNSAPDQYFAEFSVRRT